MNIENRLRNAESVIKARHRSKGEIVLYKEFGEAVDGVVVIMPSIDKEGLAKLADGTEKPIIYEPDWDYLCDVWIYKANGNFLFLDNNPIGQDRIQPEKDKLFIRYSNCMLYKIRSASKALIEGQNKSEDVDDE
jgi:hypothetical protein